MASRTLVRKQVRGFVVVWTLITAVVAGVTFFAIYLTYRGDDVSSFAENIAFPSVTEPPQQVAQNVTNATVPPTIDSAVAQQATEAATERPRIARTQTIEARATLAASGGQVAASNTPEATLTPTIPPLEDERFHVGIQVQHSLDMNQDNMDGYVRDVRQKLGLDWIKFQVRWNEIEPEKGEFHWDKMELMAMSARKFGVKLMVSVVAAPEWAWAAGVTPTDDKEVPPANPQDYVDFVTRIADGYRDVVMAIEVWNEQNLDREWYTGRSLTSADAADYVELLRRTYEGVKAVNPGMIIISGALSPGGGWTESDGRVSAIDDFSYLDSLIAAGMLDYTDCIGVHHNGYNIGPSVLWNEVENDPTAGFRGPFDNPHHTWSFRSTLETYNTKVKNAGGTQKLCITEFGWASTEDLTGTRAGFEFAGDNTLQEQADWTVEALNNMEEWGFVKLAFIWNYNYAPQAGWDANNDNVPYSFIGPDWQFRPVFDAVVQWNTARGQ